MNAIRLLKCNRRIARILFCCGIVLGAASPGRLSQAQAGPGCNASTTEPAVYIPLPGNPFSPVISPDGCRVFVVDVARAKIDPSQSVVARVPVGCNPVRLVTSPDGGTAWITTRGDHAIVAVDTGKLITDSEHAIVAHIRVGTAPVGVAIVDGGRRVIATNSNRFAGDANDRQSLSVVDVSRGAANAALLGIAPAGAFPRELCVSPDGRTLFVSNYTSKTLQVIDLSRLTPQKAP